MLPNGEQLASNSTTNLPIVSLPDLATQAYIVPELDKILISIKQLTNVGCSATFERDDATVTYQGKTILHAPLNPASGLWEVRFPIHGHHPEPQYTCNAVITGSTIAQRIAYYHACCFAPALSTWCDAIDAGFFHSFPELTSKLIKKHPPQSRAMHMGHMDQARAGVQSTQPIKYQPSSGQRRQLIAEIVPCTSFNATTYLDLPAPFLLKSSRGHKYLLIVYDTDSNYIFAEPITSREGPTIKTAYQRVVETLTAKGFKPELTITDNESSALLKTYMISQGIEYQLTPPDVHRRNAAERAIRTFKNHFVAGLCSLDPLFPLNLWDRLLPQALLTLNLLRTSNVNPLLSAHAQLFGAYDFTKHPIAPPGTRVIFHVKPNKREPWAPHGTDGWYLGPTFEHYRSWHLYNPSTKAEVFSDTVAWFPHTVTMPTASSAEKVDALIHDLIFTLRNPSPPSALSPLTDNQLATLLNLADIFKQNTEPIDIPEPAPRVVTADFDALEPIAQEDIARIDDPFLEVHTPEPRVGPITQTEPRVETPHTSTRSHPRVGQSSSQPITTYANYNPNGPQRRRQARKSKLAATPLAVTNRFQALYEDDNHDDENNVDEIHGDNGSDDKTIHTSNTIRQSRHTPRPNNQRTSRNKPTTTGHLHQDEDNDEDAAQPPLLRGHIPGMRKRLRHSTRHAPAYRFDHRTHRRIPLEAPELPHLPNLFPTQQHHANAVTTSLSHRKLLQGPDADEWSKATSLEFGRLAQGLPGKVEGTNTIFFIAHGLMPSHKRATYFRVVCTHKPLKPEPYRVRGTVGGDKIDYPGDVSAPTVDATTVNILLNDVVSTPDAKCVPVTLKISI